MPILEIRTEAAIADARLSALSEEINYQAFNDANSQFIGDMPNMTPQEKMDSFYPNRDVQTSVSIHGSHHSLEPETVTPAFSPPTKEPDLHVSVKSPLESNSSLFDKPNLVAPTVLEKSDPNLVVCQYMARQAIVKSSLSSFDDKPENYRTWQATFQGAIREANLGARDELHALIKNCGRSSTNQLQKISNAYINNQAEGLKEAWARLDKKFGEPYLVARSLLKEIESFPEIGPNHHEKLQDFSDHLELIKIAKRDGTLPDLNYLDTTYGMQNLVKKLPQYLRNKWQTSAYKFKLANSGRLPPFEDLCVFVKNIADQKNDLSLIFDTFASDTRKTQGSMKSFNGRDPPASKPRSIKPIVVQKTKSLRLQKINLK